MHTVAEEWAADFVMFEDIQYQQQAGVVTFKILAEVLGVHAEPFHLESVSVFLAGGQDSCMSMVGHGDVDDDDHVFPPGAKEDVFDHHVVILFIPA